MNALKKIFSYSVGGTLRGQLLRAGGASVVIRVSSLLATFSVSVLLARSLGPDQFGIYAYVFAIVSILSLPAQVGLPQLMVRETAKAEANEDWPRMKGFWLWSTKVVLLGSLLMACGGLLVAWYFRAGIDSDTYQTLLFAFLFVPLAALGALREAALRGLRRIIIGQLPGAILRPLVVVLLVGGVLLYQEKELSAPGAMLFQVVGATVAFIVGAYFLWRATPRAVLTTATPVIESRVWFLAALPLALMSGMQLISQYTDLIMLGIFKTSAEVGVYKVVISSAIFVAFGLVVVNMVMGPYIARLHAKNDMAGMQELVALGSLICATVTLPLVGVFLFWGGDILAWVYGDVYQSGHDALAILVVGRFINVFFGPVGILLIMCGLEGKAVRWLVISTGANVILNILLIPLYGGIGAAYATLLSITISHIGFWFTAKKELGIDSSATYLLMRNMRLFRA